MVIDYLGDRAHVYYTFVIDDFGNEIVVPCDLEFDPVVSAIRSIELGGVH